MGAIANTTRSDAAAPAPPPESVATPVGKPSSPPARNHPLAAALAAGLGLAILALAAPRLVGEAGLVEARQLVDRTLDTSVADVERPSAEELRDAAERIGALGGLAGDARLSTDRGLLLLRSAELSLPGPDRDALMGAARTATEAGLALSPGQPGAWSRLAYLRALSGDRAGAGDALRLSMLSGAVSPQIMPSRLRLGLFLLPELDADERALLARQIRLLWVMRPDVLNDVAEDEEAKAFVSHALDGLTEADVANFLRRHGVPSEAPVTRP